MENTCRLEKADKMSVRNIFIDKGANFKINDHITEYFLGCRQQRNKTNTTFLTSSELLKMLE